MYIYNPFGGDPADFDRDTAASRIGNRIRTIRLEEGLSQGELGEMIGLNANRVQQYENGARKPKLELCKKIASALEVETLALTDPQVTSYFGAMYAFFEMEKHFDLRLKEVNGQICICFGESQNDIRVSTMNQNLKKWYERRKQMEADILNASTEEEKKKIIHDYHMWEWNFPHPITKNSPQKRSQRDVEALIAHELEKRL